MDAIAELEAQLARYPAERYPVQHAVAQFHLGVALTNLNAADDGRRALERAVQLFGSAGMRVERAKALNALGAALRDTGDSERAADAFAEAGSEFARERLGPEEAAALFNLGLMRKDAATLRRARELFVESQLTAQTAAAERELGAVLLERGDAETAVVAFGNAASLAERVGDESARGAALNGLGLALLATGAVDEAIAAFRAAVSAHPYSVRPAEFAMTKANLALAYDHGGHKAHARLAARQALRAREAAPAVVAQAESVLARLGPVTDDLVRVVASEEPDRRTAIVREEVTRWAEAPPAQAAVDASLWVATQLADSALAEPWLGALLELPPDAMDVVVRSTLQALADRAEAEQEQFRADVASAGARFHVPQLERLRLTFERIDTEVGRARRWS